jgi:repressor LexA
MLLKDDGLPKLYDSNKNELPPEERELVAIFRELLDSNKKVLRETVRAALAIQKNTEGMYSESSDPSSAVSERPPAYMDRGTEAVPFPERRTIGIPVWGKTAAGAPLGIGDFDPYDSTRPCDAGLVKGDAADYGWLKVKGNSMTEAGIDSGDWVLIRHTEKPEHGAIMLVRHANDITLKRIKITEGEGGREEVRMCWEDGSGKEAKLDDDEYGIQGKYVYVDKQGQ